MRESILATALLAGVLTGGTSVAHAQEKAKQPLFQATSADLAFTYTTQMSAVIPGSANNFWMQGGGLNGAVTFLRGFGLATDISGVYKSRIAPGVGLGLISYMAGPRYTRALPLGGSKHQVRIFGEVLAGGVKGFDSIFPTASGISDTATAFAGQAGGGIDIAISKRFAIRAVEADYIRTKLPNNGSNAEDNLRLSFGITFHTGTH